MSDFSATVTRIDRMIENPLDCLGKGKRTIAIDIKNVKGQELVRKLSERCDVLIEPYRPGVMEKSKRHFHNALEVTFHLLIVYIFELHQFLTPKENF